MSEFDHLFHKKRKKPCHKKEDKCGLIVINNNLINRTPYGDGDTPPEVTGPTGPVA
ncbi:hypothetical protein [Geomicrobium sediminis]|uniref:Uncharacterized protein n=1 Tax=Geomicrobium sediminis TaxID=1347788 RepID=A0ABS2PFQ6_9BACL|nr:hypothetical protein [Geomicrobium sediminis]MBM7634245.1 hypothetical protein [Geomicrobium sediminis]